MCFKILNFLLRKSVFLPYHFKIVRPCPFKIATSEAGARWPRFGLVVVATTSCRDNTVQMIRPYVQLLWSSGRCVVSTQTPTINSYTPHSMSFLALIAKMINSLRSATFEQICNFSSFKYLARRAPQSGLNLQQKLIVAWLLSCSAWPFTIHLLHEIYSRHSGTVWSYFWAQF
jgi:hypothetical protein